MRRTREPECPPIHAGEVSRIRGTGAIRYSLFSVACPLGNERADLRFGRGAYQDSTLRGEPNCPAPEGIRDAVDVGTDNRHTLVTELAESGAGDEVIMSIAGHVSRVMLSRYSHVQMGAKRRALDEIAGRQWVADEKRKEEAAQEQAAAVPQPAVVQ